MTVRTMRGGDAAAVATLLMEGNEEHLAVFPPEVASGYRRELAGAAEVRPGTEIFVAERAGRVVGTVTLVADAADDSHPWPPGGSVLRLLAVDASARGAGVGNLLARHCIDVAAARGSAFVGLHTSPAMAAARRIYERLGFVRSPENDFDPFAHYGDGPGADPGTAQGMAYVLQLRQPAR